MEPKVIYEDESLLILDKPAGWIVNRAASTKGKKVVQTRLEEMAYPLAKNREMRSGIVHRTDKETSGILLVAKTKKALKSLQKQFKKRKVTKKYQALVHGIIEEKEGIIKAPVGRLPWNRERFGVLPGGKKAETRYRLITNLKDPASKKPYSLLELKPKTGRTHQIRVHLKYLGHPIVADEFYAGRKTARADRLWCPRLFLHASEIEFIHPGSKKKVYFKCEMEADLSSVMETLKAV